jgi:mono/diheme cytochrome c family protein
MHALPLLASALWPALLAGDPAAAVTYSRDIAPIFQARCQECHRPGEVAPMPLLSFDDARPYARSIKKLVEARTMPPWHADPAHGKWKNDPRLSDEEIAKIGSWVDAGAPEGDPKDLPPPRSFTPGWRIGKPDVVFTIPQEFRVPAEGTVREVPYKYFMVATGFTEDKWVQAAEARPGNREVVHHILVFVQEPGEQRGLGRGTDLRKHLCGNAPGNEADVFPPGTAKLIKAGSYLIFQVHYTPKGKEATDRSSVGLVFAREPPRHRLRVQGVLNSSFRIPPGASDHVVVSRFTSREDSTLWAFMPHMHLRGKSFRYDVVYPDGREETLLNVPRYDFNWQHSYRLAEPLPLPRGSRITCTAVFDNSAANRANPDPKTEVRWGDQTWEEMMIGFVTLTRTSEDLARERTF